MPQALTGSNLKMLLSSCLPFYFDIKKIRPHKMGPDLVGREGLEPSTNRLKVDCSTTELTTRARPEGFEPPTYRSEVCHSIQLS